MDPLCVSCFSGFTGFTGSPCWWTTIIAGSYVAFYQMFLFTLALFLHVNRMECL